MIGFIDDYRGAYGVEPISRVLKMPRPPITLTTRGGVALRRRRRASSGMQRCAWRMGAVFDENFEVYGVRKVWRQLVREGEDVGPLHGGPAYAQNGLAGRHSWKTREDDDQRQGRAMPAGPREPPVPGAAPERAVWGLGLYIRRHLGGLRLRGVKVIDAYARRIVGWRVSRSAHAGFVLDALEQALHDRRPVFQAAAACPSQRQGQPDRLDQIHRAPRRGRPRTLRGQRRRQLRQCLGRNDQRSLQGRGDPTGAALGVLWKPSSTPRSNGWTGSTTGGFSSPSATSRPPRLKPPTMPNSRNRLWPRLNSTQIASGVFVRGGSYRICVVGNRHPVGNSAQIFRLCVCSQCQLHSISY